MMSLTKALVALLLIVAGLAFSAQNAVAVKSISLDSAIENFTQILNNQLSETSN